MWNPFSKAKRVQSLLVITDAQHIVPTHLPVEKQYCVDHKSREAWALPPAGSMLKNRRTGVLTTFVSEHDAAPLIFNGRTAINHKRLNEQANTIAEEALQSELYDIEIKAKKNKLMDTLSLLALIFGVVVAVLVIAGMIMAGKFNLPF